MVIFRQAILIVAFLIAMPCFGLCSPQEPPQAEHTQESNKHANASSDEQQITKSIWQRISIIWDRTWDDPVAFYTFILSIFTALLAIVSFTQIYFLTRSDKTARIAADAAKEAAEASARQASIAENALTQLERPYVFIFGVRGIQQDRDSRDFFVEFTVANYGKMPAIIEALHIGFDKSDCAEPPMPPLLRDAHNLIASPILQAGEVRRKIRTYFPSGMVGPDINAIIETVRARDFPPNPILDGQAEEQLRTTVVPTFNIPDGFDVFFRAVIRYRGPFTKSHETGAVWLYNPDTFEFAIRDGEEHNYIK